MASNAQGRPLSFTAQNSAVFKRQVQVKQTPNGSNRNVVMKPTSRNNIVVSTQATSTVRDTIQINVARAKKSASFR